MTGGLLPTTVDATHEPARGVTGGDGAGAAPCSDTELSRQHSRTVWEPRSRGFTFSNYSFFKYFFFVCFLVILITVLKYCLAYRIASRSARTRQWAWLGFCTYETLQCLCADRDLPVCLRCILSLHLTLTSLFCFELVHLKKKKTTPNH